MLGIRRNFENYDKVREAFKELIHTLVWESTTIEEGATEEEVNNTIDRYCAYNDGHMIDKIQDDVISFIKSHEPHYHVRIWLGDDELENLETDNLGLCVKKVTKAYADNKDVVAYIYDNFEERMIVELSGVV